MARAVLPALGAVLGPVLLHRGAGFVYIPSGLVRSLLPADVLPAGAQGLYHALTATLPASPPSGILYLDNKGVVLEPSKLIAEGSQKLVQEWALGEEEIEGWET